MTSTEIAAFLGEELLVIAPANDRDITAPAALHEARPGDIAFASANAKDAASTQATLLIVDRLAFDRESLGPVPAVATVILSDNPRLSFMRVVAEFFPPAALGGIHHSAVIDPGATIATNVAIGALATIDRDVSIGEDSVIHAGVHIYHGVRIGRRVIVHSGSVIGADGFGYERDSTGAFVKFPHVGRIEIGDDVEIGSNACIDRGTLGATRIGNGVKIDNLVHVSHNVQIGDHSAVIAHAMIGGSTSIGRYSWIAPSACVRDRISLGDRVTVGLASLVTHDVPAGATVMGSPARDILEYRASLRR